MVVLQQFKKIRHFKKYPSHVRGGGRGVYTSYFMVCVFPIYGLVLKSLSFRSMALLSQSETRRVSMV